VQEGRDAVKAADARVADALDASKRFPRSSKPIGKVKVLVWQAKALSGRYVSHCLLQRYLSIIMISASVGWCIGKL